MERDEICHLLAVFDESSLFNIVVDRVSDLSKRGESTGGLGEDRAFQKRLNETAAGIQTSDVSDAILRLRLWDVMQSAFDLHPTLPLSTRSANFRAAAVAQGAADCLASSLTEEENSDWTATLQRVWNRVEAMFSRERIEFAEVVGLQASRLLAEAAKQGRLDETAKAELIERVRKRLDELPPELRDESVERAIKVGDTAALTLLASGTSLVSLGIAVELAGFSAYILAAQASAIIPLLGGKAAVSGLFVLSHPLFIVPALLGGGYLASRHLGRSVRTRLASSLATLMALKGLSAGRGGLQQCLDGFKSINASDLGQSGIDRSKAYDQFLTSVSRTMGGSFPPTPGHPESALAKKLDGRTSDGLGEALFPKESSAAGEAFAVGGLTLGDVVYDAVAIDPSVIAAADFSRAEDLAGVYKFGAFADRMKDMSEEALRGAESNLRGYVAEQIVAARLVENGHQVSLPDDPNNPGYDFLVDGHEFQVKCLSGIEGLREHFGKYPDIPVFANAELAPLLEQSTAEWAGKVFFIEGYDSQVTDHVMGISLESGAALDDVDVPVFAVAVSLARNIHGWWKGSISLADLPFEVAMDGAVKGGLAAAGGFAGKALGLLVFGPAGAVVFGGVAGAAALLGSGWARDMADRALVDEWIDDLGAASTKFGQALKKAMLLKVDIASEKIGRSGPLNKPEALWIRLRMQDDALAIVECVCLLDALRLEAKPPELARGYLRLMHEAGVHPWAVDAELRGVMRVLSEKPSLGDVASSKVATAGRRLSRFWDSIMRRNAKD